MEILRTAYAPLVILAILLGVGSTSAQQEKVYSAFTLVLKYTDYDEKDRYQGESIWTHYQSATGEWRTVMEDGDYVRALLYRRDRGSYKSSSRVGVLIKGADHALTWPVMTAAQLRDDPKFARTEMVKGFTAYVHRQMLYGDLIEEYFVPEVGSLSIKGSTRYADGTKSFIEPVVLLLGEPAKEDLNGPDYPVIEQRPQRNADLAKLILTKPDPVYPLQAIVRRIAGTASVQVTVDTNGRVIWAGASSSLPYINFAAQDAAYNATFRPTISNGKPVVAYGSIEYEFVLPAAVNRLNQVTDDQKQEFIKLLRTLPKCGESYCDTAIEKAGPYLPVSLALTEQDLQKLDINPFAAIIRGLNKRLEHREYAMGHFTEIRHPTLKLFWAVLLFDGPFSTGEIIRFLRDAFESPGQTKVILEMLGPRFEGFRNQVLGQPEAKR